MKKLYTVLMIVLPLFVGAAGIIELISYLTENGSTMNPIICVLMTVAGLLTGIRNILKLINKN